MSSFENWLAQLNISDLLFIPIKILIVIAVCVVAITLGRKIIRQILKRNGDDRSKVTIMTVFMSFWKYLIYFIGAITILSIVNINIAPVLASAGVLGLAVGFGAQNLVKDVISGFFIIFDRYYAVGDYISTGKVSGYVQEIGLRSTRVKDWGGEVYFFPNGEVSIVTNYSRENLVTYFHIPISYEANIDEAINILKETCIQMAQQLPAIKDGPYVLGVDLLEDNLVKIKISFGASLEDKFALERELKKQIITDLTQAGIKLSVNPLTKLLTSQGPKVQERGQQL